MIGDDALIVAMAADRIAKGSKSFAGAARLFDRDTRASAFMLYAWCRHCDDEIDGQVLGFGRQAFRKPPKEVLAELRAGTMAAIEGKAVEPIYQALQRVVEKHQIPAQHPLDLVRGMEMDVETETDGRAYATLNDTLAYCYHVAGVVGVMMAMVMGVRETAVLQRASDLGIAFQLTNIARDLVADAEVKRVYLPETWIVARGLSAATLGQLENRATLAALTADLLDVAETYYASAHAGLSHLPFRSAWAVASARRVYRDIGSIVRRRGDRAWDQRASTSTARKLAGFGLAAADAGRAGLSAKGQPSPSRCGLWTPPSLRQ
jgi:15-cis-phytoene synthase